MPLEHCAQVPQPLVQAGIEAAPAHQRAADAEQVLVRNEHAALVRGLMLAEEEASQRLVSGQLARRHLVQRPSEPAAQLRQRKVADPLGAHVVGGAREMAILQRRGRRLVHAEVKVNPHRPVPQAMTAARSPLPEWPRQPRITEPDPDLRSQLHVLPILLRTAEVLPARHLLKYLRAKARVVLEVGKGQGPRRHR